MLQTFFDNYFAFALTAAMAALIVYHFNQIAQGTGTLTQGTATFVKAFEQ